MTISIIIPTYNRKGLLHEALTRLFDGMSADFECVIVDDASTDRTGDAVEGWRHQFGRDRITYWRQERSQGAQAARNLGIEESTGDFLLFMDSDDIACPAGILSLRDHLDARPEIEYCYGRVVKTDLQLNSLTPEEAVGAPFASTPFDVGGYDWHTMGALYRRRCIERVGPWNLELTGSQDWEYQARVKLFGGMGQFVDIVVGYWRQHDGERVGTSRFRPDYVHSVMLACDSILRHARQAGRCDAHLEARIAKRLFVHALEWGANGYPAERRECLGQAKACFSSTGSFRRLLSFFARTPPVCDGMLRLLLLKTR